MKFASSIEFVEKQKLLDKTASTDMDTITGMLLKANYGTANIPVRISTESELIKYFGYPTEYNYLDWFNAAGYLKFAKDLYVVRPVSTSAVNACIDISSTTVSNDETESNLYNEDVAEITLESAVVGDNHIRFYNRCVSSLNDISVITCTNETEYEESVSKDDIFDNTLAVKTVYDRSTLPPITTFANRDRIAVKEALIETGTVTAITYYVYYLNKTSSTVGTWVKTTDTIEDADRVFITSERLAYDVAIDFTSAPTYQKELYDETTHSVLAFPDIDDYEIGDKILVLDAIAHTWNIYEKQTGETVWIDTTINLVDGDEVLVTSTNKIRTATITTVPDDISFADYGTQIIYTDSFTPDISITAKDEILIKKDSNVMITNSVVRYMTAEMYDSNYNPLTFSNVLAKKPDFTKNEIGVLVFKRNLDGYFEVVENFTNSLDADSKSTNGTSNYIDININKYSKYIYCKSNICALTDVSTNAYSVNNLVITDKTEIDYSNITSYSTLYDVANSIFGTNGYVQPELLIGYDCGDQTLYSGYLNGMSLIANSTEMSLAIISPTRSTVGVSDEIIHQEMIDSLGNKRSDTSFGGLTEFNSYTFVAGTMKKFYDKYNDKFRWVSVAGDIAGQMTRNDKMYGTQSALSGYNRGQFTNFSKMLFNSTNQDELSYNAINAIVYDRDENKYFLMDYLTNTTLDEITKEANIRRMVIRIKHLLRKELRNAYFEFNDATQRAITIFKIDGIFKKFKNNGGLYDYLLICDETNNTPEQINKNEFILDVRLQPNRNIKHIIVNFTIFDQGINIQEF